MAVLPVLLDAASSSAVHLEMRDTYEAIDPDWFDWQRGERFDPAVRWSGWFDLVRRKVARGVSIRRARIITARMTDYIRYEHDVTAAHNIAAGEEVRWLYRRSALGLLVPLTDFWVVDDAVLVLNHFDSTGAMTEERRDDPELVSTYAGAFEAVWEQSVPHAEFVI